MERSAAREQSYARTHGREPVDGLRSLRDIDYNADEREADEEGRAHHAHQNTIFEQA